MKASINIEYYFNQQGKKIAELLSKEVNVKTISKVTKDSIKNNVDDLRKTKFQKYYFETLNNEKLFLSSKDFFIKFKSEYGLQGISKEYLNHLEQCKEDILSKIKKDELAELYFTYFFNVKIKHGKGTLNKTLGSFFSKLVHTFNPEKYCALDNPIKNYFGLKNESFFIAFHIISEEYSNWAKMNKSLMDQYRKDIKKHDPTNIFDTGKISDMKIIDLIFWDKSNI